MNFIFYEKVLKKYIDYKSKILVLAAGKNDYFVLNKLNYENVTLSNLDKRMNAKLYKPFQWSFQNAESLTFEDNKFDFVIIHEGLHHCFSPHKALLEMYRVAKKGVLCIESRDSFLMRIFLRLNLAYQYEHPAVFHNNFLYGGVANSEIPNYVYRWKEEEIKKTINCFAPYSDHQIYFDYDLNMPSDYKKIFLIDILSRFLKVIFKKICPTQLNLFSFFIKKPDLKNESFPWINYEENKIQINKKWLKLNWKKKINR